MEFPDDIFEIIKDRLFETLILKVSGDQFRMGDVVYRWYYPNQEYFVMAISWSITNPYFYINDKLLKLVYMIIDTDFVNKYIHRFSFGVVLIRIYNGHNYYKVNTEQIKSVNRECYIYWTEKGEKPSYYSHKKYFMQFIFKD
jgi:hypothetical protein